VTAALEADSNKGPDAVGGKDGGDHNFVYEAGTNKKLTPSSIQARAEPDSLKQGLVLWLTFDEGTGTTTKDLSGNGNNGTLYNFNFTATSGWTTGKVGGALSFDGVNDYVEIPNSSSLNPTKITIVYWFYSREVGIPQKTILQKPYTSHSSPYYQYATFLYNSALHTRFSIGSASSQTAQISNISPNIWYYYAVTYDGTYAKTYLNSELKTNNQFTGSIDGYNTVIQLAAYPNLPKNSNYCWNGLIDEVRIYNRALSDSEIKALYDATK
jgi:hypothetical protein